MSDTATIPNPLTVALSDAALAVSGELVRQEMSGDHDEPEADRWVAQAAVAAWWDALPPDAGLVLGGEWVPARKLAQRMREGQP